jgi:hypothetical protein
LLRHELRAAAACDAIALADTGGDGHTFADGYTRSNRHAGADADERVGVCIGRFGGQSARVLSVQ